MKRKDFIKLSSAAGVYSMMPGRKKHVLKTVEKNTILIHTEDETGRINPELHGHFLEHLGSATYGGIWVGKNSSIPNINGYRKKAVEYLKVLEMPVLRWPGGCFADDYHWRDGIGPADQRPKRVNMWWGKYTEDNSFGTHEFMGLTRLLGTESYLAGNLGSGTPQELRDWVEYCNYPLGSTLADERIANGDKEPFNVRYWGVGNESWACGGHMTPEEYCSNYARYATFLQRFGKTSPFLIAVGPNSNDKDWTRRFFTALTKNRDFVPQINGFAMHFYSWAQKSLPGKFTADAMYEQLNSFRDMETAIIEQYALIGEFKSEKRFPNIRLLVDEWGTWKGKEPELEAKYGRLFQPNTMIDALAAGLGLNVFHRQADKLAMCNLAQLVNVLQAPILAHGDECIRTPTYYALLICKGHQGKQSLRFDQNPLDREQISVSVSRSEKEMVITLVNISDNESKDLTLETNKGNIKRASGQIVHHPDRNAQNTFDKPDEIVAKPFSVETHENKIKIHLPSLSVVTITGELS